MGSSGLVLNMGYWVLGIRDWALRGAWCMVRKRRKRNMQYAIRHGGVGRLLSFGLLSVLVQCAGCGSPPQIGSGTVRFQLTADVRDVEGLAALGVEVKAVGVQRAGQPIDQDWVWWPPAQTHVDLVALGDSVVQVAEGELPAGRYDRAWVVVEDGAAQSTSGERIPLIFTVEPIAIPLELKPGAPVQITVELIALPQADGGYELFTKSATIDDGP
jgi:hypothetical protein